MSGGSSPAKRQTPQQGRWAVRPLFLWPQMDCALRPPGAAYYLIVAAGLAASLGIIGSTLPLLRRITGPEAARNE